MNSKRFFANVEAAIYKDDKWLMITRSKKETHAAGMLSMVGGTVEFTDDAQDTLEQALRREVQEEVGVTLAGRLRYLESKQFVSDSGEHVLDIVFMAAYESGEPKALNLDEVASVQWMTFREIESHAATPPWILQSMRLAEEARLKARSQS